MDCGSVFKELLKGLTQKHLILARTFWRHPEAKLPGDALLGQQQ